MIITKRGKYGLKPIQFVCKCGCEFNADVYEVCKCRNSRDMESELRHFAYTCPECDAMVYTAPNPAANGAVKR